MAASRREDEQYCEDVFTKYESVAILLALALQSEDADRFLEVYDNVIPEYILREEVEVIKDRARELASLPQDTLHRLQKQCNKGVKDATENKQSTSLCSVKSSLASDISNEVPCKINRINKGVTRTLPEITICQSLSLSPKCSAIAMEGSTPLSGVAVSSCRNEPNKHYSVLSKSKNIWNNNNTIEREFVGPDEPGGTYFVTNTNILNGNGVGHESFDTLTKDLSNRKSPVPVGNIAQTNCCEPTTLSVVHSCTKANQNNRGVFSSSVPVKPYSHKALLKSAVELIDSRPCRVSGTCPKPAFVDPNKPDQVLQMQSGKTDMAAASNTPNTKKTAVLANVRLAPATKGLLPNGSINNKKTPSVTSLKGNSVPNDKTPLMGNSQRTDSECVKQYGTNVPSSRHDHLQSSSAGYNVDSDEPQDRGKFALSSGESDGMAGSSGSKPATLGEQFEASKAQEGKKKKSKKKKKKVPEQEKGMNVSVGINDNKEVFEDACTDLPPPKNPLVSSDSLTSNEEFSSDTGGGSAGPVRPTIASKMMDGSFHVDEHKIPSVSCNLDDSSVKGDCSAAMGTNCRVQEGAIANTEKENNTVTTQTKINKTCSLEITPSQYKTDFKTTLKSNDNVNDKILANDRKMDSSWLNMTAHSTNVQKETVDMNDLFFQDADETNAGDDDGEFQEVMSSRRSRRARKIKGVSLEDKTYPYQTKQIDKDQLRRGGGSSGMRKSSSEPASMARLGETEPEPHTDNVYTRRLHSRNGTAAINRDATDKPALVLPPKPNTELPTRPVTISYAGKVKAGIAHHASAQAPKSNNNPVKFTLEDEHSDGHISDSSIKSPQNDAPQSQRTTNPLNLCPPTSFITSRDEASKDIKVTDEATPKQDTPVQRTGGTSPQFEISFGEFNSVYISGAPKSLKSSSITTSEGLNMNPRPLQKVTRSNSVDGMETEGTTVSENPLSTTQQHQEANVQYLDLQSANTYAGRLKRSLHANPPQGLKPRAQVFIEPMQATVQQNEQVVAEANLLPELAKSNVENTEKLNLNIGTSGHFVKGVEIKLNHGKLSQVTPPQSCSHNVVKQPLSSTHVENKSHQGLKAAHATGVITSSPTPSISSSKGVSSSVCFPLKMEPIDLGITFGDVNISEVLNEQLVVARQDSPVDKIMASADEATYLPQVPSTGHSCTDLETAWRDEDKIAPVNHPGGGAEKMAVGGANQNESHFGSFNYYEVADMLMKAWTSTLEQKEANPSKVQYYKEDACI